MEHYFNYLLNVLLLKEENSYSSTRKIIDKKLQGVKNDNGWTFKKQNMNLKAPKHNVLNRKI